MKNTKVMTLSLRRGFTPIIILIAVLIVVAIAGAFYLGKQNGTVNYVPNPILYSPTPTTYTQPTSDLKTFSDPNLVGFSLQYNQRDWVTKTEDLKLCNDVACNPSVGKTITLTNKNYPDPLRSIILTITLRTDHPSQYSNNKICFPPENIQTIGQGWYKTQNPFITNGNETRDHLWTRWFYQTKVISENQGQKCVFGSVNEPEGSTTPILYQGKQTWLSIWLDNKFSPDQNNIADEIIKTIKFTQ